MPIINTLILLLCISYYVITSHSQQTKACDKDPNVEVTVEGSNEAEKCEFPFYVSLKDSLYKAHLCGGTLINSRWVLTAASCFDDSLSQLDSKPFVDINGHYLEGPFEERIQASMSIQHPDYDNDFPNANDIALVKLSSPYTKTSPVKLVSKSSNVKTGDNMEIIGFGRIYALGPISGFLRHYDKLSVLSSCSDWTDDSTGLICTDKGGSDACHSDLGGPLVKYYSGNLKQVGIASLANGNCLLGDNSAVFIDIRNHIEWIEKTMANN